MHEFDSAEACGEHSVSELVTTMTLARSARRVELVQSLTARFASKIEQDLWRERSSPYFVHGGIGAYAKRHEGVAAGGCWLE